MHAMDDEFDDATFVLSRGWSLDDDDLITCCGEVVELDADECPACGAPNPLIAEGLI